MNLDRIFKLIPQVDLSSPEKLRDFKAWQDNDGTLKGLQRLIKDQKENKGKFMQNLRMFEVKYLGATNTRGSRVKITDTRFQKSVILSVSYKVTVLEQAKEFLESKGIKLVSRTWDERTKNDYLMTDNFMTQIKGE